MEENLGNRVSAETISAITDRVLPEIKAWRSRSLDDVYPIVWIDAIQSVFPDTIVQLCIVHQICNSIKYVESKHQKEFLKDLKRVYGAVSKDAAETELLNLDEKWGDKYPIVIKS